MTNERRDEPWDPSGGAWVSQSLGGILERMKAQQADAEAHAASCTDRPCERCGRYVCRLCKQPVDGAKTCRACDEADYRTHRLKPTRDSIPSHFRWALDATPEKLRGRVQANAETIRRGLEAPPSTSLLFIGPSGTGKTSLAVAMLDVWVRLEPGKRSGARFVEAGWLARARARHRLGEEAPLVENALQAPLLVLDDLGCEREDRDGCITDVIYGRSNADLPTWVTCGLQPEAKPKDAEEALQLFAAVLAKRYDGGFVRRILETGKRVQLGGNS